jgi:hypothetical protein
MLKTTVNAKKRAVILTDLNIRVFPQNGIAVFVVRPLLISLAHEERKKR